MYEYSADVIRVIDGDTVIVAADLGFRITHTITLRLTINAPEIRGGTAAEKTKGYEAKYFLEDLIMDCGPITVKTERDRTGKFGRYLAVLHGVDCAGSPINLNRAMVDAGHAESL